MNDKKAAEKVAIREVYGETLARLGRDNKNIVVLDADLSGSTKTSFFADQDDCAPRFFDMGIAEMDMMGTAAGLAAAGKIPFVSTFAIFAAGRAWAALRQSVCYPKANVKVVASHGGITVGSDGGSHQSVEDLAITRAIPNLSVIVPGDGPETIQAIERIVETPGPFYVRLSRVKFPRITPEGYRFEIGKGLVLREGGDVTIVGIGYMVHFCLEAAGILEKEGVAATVIDMASLKPIDADLIAEAAGDTGALVTAEEHSVIGGLGGAVAEVLGERSPAPLERIGVPDCFGVSGEPEELFKHFGMLPQDIAAAARRAISRKK